MRYLVPKNLFFLLLVPFVRHSFGSVLLFVFFLIYFTFMATFYRGISFPLQTPAGYDTWPIAEFFKLPMQYAMKGFTVFEILVYMLTSYARIHIIKCLVLLLVLTCSFSNLEKLQNVNQSIAAAAACTFHCCVVL